MKISSLQLAGIFLALCTVNAPAAVHYVNLNCTNPVSPYASWATAATNIQDAINSAPTLGETILVTNGIYQHGAGVHSGQTQTNRVFVPFGLGLAIRSVNGPLVTVIRGYQVPGTTNGISAVRCVYLTEFSTLSGFTVTNGATQSFVNGGGVYMESNCTVSNCIIAGNAALNGGGAFTGNGSALINCVISGNVATGSGGGAYECVLTNCIVTANNASNGGGVGNCNVYNCLLTGNGNTNNTSGGAAYISRLNNCTLVGNFSHGLGAADGCTLSNSIIYYNVNGSYADCYQCQLAYCCTTLGLGATSLPNHSISNAPAFVDLAGGNFRLLPWSPCVNAGTNIYAPSGIDLDGNPRIVGGTVDMGAYENQNTNLIHYVSISNTAPVSPFTNWITAATNIQDAIDVANAGEFVVVSNGIYQTGGRAVYGTASNRIVLDKAVTVQSVNGAASVIILGAYTAPTHGGPNIRCAYLTNGAVLNGFTLANGGTPTVLGDLTREASGGGVWCEGVSASISNCIIVGNTSGYGGGGAYSGTLTSCTLSSNAVVGGRGWGGGAWTSTLNNCVLLRNNGYEGGGAMSGRLGNCLLVGNSAGYGGGAFSSILINCTVVSNSATYSGGGLSGGSADSFSTNCIVYYNAAPTGPNWSGGNLGYACTTPLPAGAGNITNVPLFVSPAAMNFRLQSNSPCINAGNNSGVTATDLNGNPRISGGTVDIGTYEFQSPSSIFSYAWAQQFGLPTDGTADFTDTDGDGLNNWQEWIAGTVPTNAASVLVMTSPSNNVSGVTITWQSVSGKLYFLQRSSDLTAQPAFTALQSNIVGQVGITVYTDTTATNPTPYFYRVGVQ